MFDVVKHIKHRYFLMVLGLLTAVLFLVAVDDVIRPAQHLPESLKLLHPECAFTSFEQKHMKDLDGANWKACTLPDSWDKSYPDQKGNAWYKFQVPIESLDVDYALYLVSLNMNGEAWINGFHIGSGGSFEGVPARNWDTPLLFLAPSQALHLGMNEVVVHIIGYMNSGAVFGVPYWGTYETLHPVYWKQLVLAQVFSIGTFTLSFMLGLGVLGAYLIIRQRRLLFFGAASLISCFYVADIFLVYIPVPEIYWEIITHNAVLISQYLYFIFILDTLELHNKASRWFRYAANIHVFTFVLIVALSPEVYQLPLSFVGHLVGIILLLWVDILLWRKWLQDGDVVTGSFAVSVCVEGLAMSADWVSYALEDAPLPPFLFPLGPLSFSLVAAAALLYSFVRANQQEVIFRQRLHASLQAQAQELEKKHQEIATFEQKMKIQHEQERITRELHDGLGAHLVGVKGLLDSDVSQAKALIDDGLLELRSLMDSLDSESNLMTMLGMMRQRMESRLKAKGIHFDWQVWDLPDKMPKTPQANHHMMRAIQESITNIEKHAQATEIKLVVNTDEIIIQDNGHGFDVESIQYGRGLKNIEWRCEEVSAHLNIQSSQVQGKQGTTVHITWPMWHHL